MTEITPDPQSKHTELTADIVAAYVSNNSVPVADLPALLSGIYSALCGLGQGAAPEAPAVGKPTPAQIRKSVKDDALVSFIDGKPYKTLKRHLTGNGLTFEQYRERFGLPRDYPSTAPSYSAQRSALAKSLGLGQQRRKAAKAGATVETIAEAPKKAVRSKKDAESAARPAKARRKASATVAAE